MKTMYRAAMITVLASFGFPKIASASEVSPTVPKWEYRVLTKDQLLDLGKKDLAAGLNLIGDEGWELVAVEPAFIFKRPKDQIRKQATDLKSRMVLIEADVDALRDRVAWTERMYTKGFVSQQQLQFERSQLKRGEAALESVRRELQALPPEPSDKPEKAVKPDRQ